MNDMGCRDINFERLSLLSSDLGDNDVMDAHEFINYEVDFDLNNPYEPTDEDFLDILPSEDLEIVADEVMDLSVMFCLYLLL